jgi:SAM-dependent methyltransferase
VPGLNFDAIVKPHHETDPTRRFSGRVDDYVQYRPHYPAAVLEWLVEDTGLEPSWTIADVGSGTGILSSLFLENGNTVYGVEPNAAMRSAGERYLVDYKNFVSVDGRAEATGLEPASVALVSAGQAFHWFDAVASGREFRRILKPGGWVSLVWNSRKTEATAFMRDYETLLIERAIDYERVDHRNVDPTVFATFFDGYRRHKLDNRQDLDYASLEGRLMSSSYAPTREHPRHRFLVEGLKAVFAAHQKNGLVAVEYETEIYLGSPADNG